MNNGGFTRFSISKLLFNAALWKMGASRLHNVAAMARYQELSSKLHSMLGNAVLAGPFTGMVLPTRISNQLMPKLLGTYEANLRESVAKAVKRNPAIVINVGCAEGYYAVGLARLLPRARVYAFDIAPDARSICAVAAENNAVADRVIVEAGLTPERFSEILASPERILVVMDCEGAERELLDPELFPSLAKCDVIVETHGLDIASLLESRFRSTHRVDRIEQGGRDPNEVMELRKLAESDRWLLVDEVRPESMTWLALWSNLAPD
jgi:precorrin-6B methylase 2